MMTLNEVETSAVRAFETTNAIVNPGCIRRGNDLTWPNYDSPIIGPNDGPEKLRHFIENRQYSFQNLLDGGIFQLLYRFDDTAEKLTRARLVYLTESDDDRLLWLRMEYSPHLTRGISHPTCHLHFVGSIAARLAVRGVPSPLQFVDFVIGLLYPDEYISQRLGADGKYRSGHAFPGPCIVDTEDYSCTNFVHLSFQIRRAGSS